MNIKENIKYSLGYCRNGLFNTILFETVVSLQLKQVDLAKIKIIDVNVSDLTREFAELIFTVSQCLNTK